MAIQAARDRRILMIDSIRKKYANTFLKPYLKWYLKKPRLFKFKGLKLKIYPGVFHPAFFFSTLFFASFIKKLSLKNKSFCEVGAGSGLISFIAALEGANVTAIELNKAAINGLNENLLNNSVSPGEIAIIHSDLFDSVKPQVFDVIFINPPYFFKEIMGENSLAWNCGKNGEYFKKLFSQLSCYVHKESEVYMTLAENCDISQISDIASHHQQQLICVLEKKIKWEKNFIFKVKTR